MRSFGYGFVFLASMTAVALTQQPAASSVQLHATPDTDGIYYAGPEVVAPRLLRTVAVPYPVGIAPKEVQGMTVLAMVIDAKGLPQHLQVLRTHGAAFDQAAIAGVHQSVFEPGKLAGKPVPVWIDLRVVFHANHSQAVPEVLITERDLAPPDPSKLVDKHNRPLSYIAPIPIHTVDADFADPFTKNPWVQEAVVSVLVSKEGLPKEVRVMRGLGFGLDQKAEAAVWHYKFLPAVAKGKIIEARTNVLVDFAEF